MPADRRSVLKGAGAFAVTVGGVRCVLTPRQAWAAGADFAVLAPAEAAALSALGEALALGAAEAGVAHFVDAQLAGAPEDAFLMIRYLDVPPPWDGFYSAGIAALNAAAAARHGALFSELDPESAAVLVGAMAQGALEGWTGPPQGLFYFAVRADAVDVAYGTEGGFARLGVDYLPHLPPERPW